MGGPAWIYILCGASGRHYIGLTQDLERRINEHRGGSCHSTRRLGGEITLVAERGCASLEEARAGAPAQADEKSRGCDRVCSWTEQPATLVGVGCGFESRPTHFSFRHLKPPRIQHLCGSPAFKASRNAEARTGMEMHEKSRQMTSIRQVVLALLGAAPGRADLSGIHGHAQM